MAKWLATLSILLLASCVEGGQPLDWPGDSDLRFLVWINDAGAIESISGALTEDAQFATPLRSDTKVIAIQVDLETVRRHSARVDPEALGAVRIDQRTDRLAGCEPNGNVTENVLELPLNDDPVSGLIEVFDLDADNAEFKPIRQAEVPALSPLSLYTPLLSRCAPGFRVDVQPYGARSPYFNAADSRITIDGVTRTISPLDWIFRDARTLGADQLLVLSPGNLSIVGRGSTWADTAGRAKRFDTGDGLRFPAQASEVLFGGQGLEYWPERGDGLIVFHALDRRPESLGASVPGAAWMSFSLTGEQLALGRGHAKLPNPSDDADYSLSDVAGPSGEYVAAGDQRTQTATSPTASPFVIESVLDLVDEVRWVEGYERYLLGGNFGLKDWHPADGAGGPRVFADRGKIGRVHALDAEMVDGALEILAGSTEGRLWRYRRGDWHELQLELPAEAKTCSALVCGRRVPSPKKFASLAVVNGPDARRYIVFVIDTCAAVFVAEAEAECVTMTPFVASDGDPTVEFIDGEDWDLHEVLSVGESALLVGSPGILEEARIIPD